MKILLTGVTGFLGSHLAERLAAMGHEIRCLVRSSTASLPEDMGMERLEVRTVDFMDADALVKAMDGIQRVFHVAGTTRARSTRDYYDGNYIVTQNLAEASLAHGGDLDRFVFVSSLSALGPSEPGEEPDERAPYHPVSHYGKTKMMAEQCLRRLDGKLPIVIVRPSGIYGPRERDLYQYFRLIIKGFFPRIGFGKKFLNMAYCDDVINGILLASESPRAPEKTYFIGSQRSYETAEIAGEIARAVGVKAHAIPVPEIAVRIIGGLSELKGRLTRTPVFFNMQKACEACAAAWNCSIALAQEELGYVPAVSLADGIDKTYRWYRSNGLLDL
jgi:nucleoside-diphosphate-sugar epimerase